MLWIKLPAEETNINLFVSKVIFTCKIKHLTISNSKKKAVKLECYIFHNLKTCIFLYNSSCTNRYRSKVRPDCKFHFEKTQIVPSGTAKCRKLHLVWFLMSIAYAYSIRCQPRLLDSKKKTVEDPQTCMCKKDKIFPWPRKHYELWTP